MACLHRYAAQIALALLAAGLLSVAPAAAQPFTVTNTDDTGVGSLRQAVTDAEATFGPDVIVFDGLADGSTITLLSALPTLMQDLEIDGTTATNLTIATGGSPLSVSGLGTQLTIRDLALDGDVALAGSALVAFDVSADTTYGGIVSGSGAFAKLGAGALTVTGASSVDAIGVFEGTLVLEEETTAGSIVVADPSALMVFDTSSSASYAGVVSGPGALEKRGSGTLTLSGMNTLSGTTTVSEGRLDVAVADALPGPVEIAPPATVGGEGGIGGLTSSGTVSPGARIGTLTVNGNATLAPGSFLDIEFESPTSNDLLAVTGSAEVGGAILRILLDPGVDTVTDRTILTAGGGVIGDFDASFQQLAFLDVAVTTNPNDVTVSVFPNANTFAQFAETPNQTAVAQALDAAAPGAMGDLADVFATLRGSLQAEDVPPTLDSIGGEGLTAFATPWLRARSRFQRAIDARVGGFAARSPYVVAGGPSALQQIAAVSAGPGSAAAFGDETGPGGWLDGYAVFGDIDAGTGRGDLDYSVYGGAVGVDHRPTRHLLVGGAAGYARLEPNVDGRSLDGHGDTLQAALYGAYRHGRIHGAVSAGGGYGFFQTDRRLEGGSLVRTTDADFEGWEVSAHAEVGVEVVELAGLRFEPLASFDWTHLERDAYDESGADSLDLEVDDARIDSLVSGVGLRVGGTFTMSEEAEITPVVHARWTHEFGDTERELDARLAGAPGAGAFRVDGAEIGRDALEAGAGYVVSVAPGVHIYANYDVLWNPDILEHTARGGFQVVW